MLAAELFYFAILLNLLKQRRLQLKYTLLWLAFGIIMIVLTLFPSILDAISNFVGIYNPVNALFAIACFCFILILVSLTAIVSKQNEKIKHLVQYTALLEERVRNLESKLINTELEDTNEKTYV